MEKVWVQEQKAEVETKKIEQLKKEKEEERKAEELQQMAAQATGTNKLFNQH